MSDSLKDGQLWGRPSIGDGALSLVGVAWFAAGAAVTEKGDLMQQHGRDLVIDDPAAALMGLVSRCCQIGYFNSLPTPVVPTAVVPTSVVPVGPAPAMLIVGLKQPVTMLEALFSVYALSRLTALDVSTWPTTGSWSFDPFAWQFPMATGAVGVGFQVQAGGFEIPRPLAATAMAIVLGAAFWTTDGLGSWPTLDAAVRPFLDRDETMQGRGRVVHALSLACSVHSIGTARLLQEADVQRSLCLSGQNGLAMFGLGSLLPVIGQVLGQTSGHPPLMDAGMIAGGLSVMRGIADLLSRRVASARTAGTNAAKA